MDALVVERFWSKVDTSGECWTWQGGKGSGGYGQAKRYGHQVGAHRLSWEIASGPIPDGLNVLHRCDNRGCVRPSHLFLGTQRDNLRDMVAKGRGLTSAQQAAINHPRGDDHWTHKHPEQIARGSRSRRSKLTEDQVIDIRRLSREGWTLARLSAEYGVRMSTLSYVIRRETWTHVEDR